jgi:hypothetical protein
MLRMAEQPIDPTRRTRTTTIRNAFCRDPVSLVLLQVCICRSFFKKLLVAYLEYIILLHASKYQGFGSTMSGKQPTKSTRFGMSSAGTHARSKRT